MFSEFVGMSGKRYCKILMTCVSESDPVSSLLEELGESGLDFVGNGIGEMYAIQLSEAIVIEDMDIF